MAKQKTLLEKAKEVPIHRTQLKDFNGEDIELLIAWFKDEITLSQITEVKQFPSPTTVYQYLSKVSKHLYWTSNYSEENKNGKQ